MNKWDTYFYKLCTVLSEQSSCLSRNIGCVIAINKRLLSTGYNGPPEGIHHCAPPTCPRQLAGYKSGEGLHICPAAHAEQNAIVNAARVGTCIYGATLYLNTVIPCKSCLGLIINAGIVEVVSTSLVYYDKLTSILVSESGLKVRTFEGEVLE